MYYVLEFIGFVRAWLDALGFAGLVLVGLFALIFYWTRRRPGQRRGRTAPPIPQSQDSWWFSG